MEFKISKELIQELELLIQTKNDQQLEVLLNDMHHADIAEVLDELDFDEATYIFKVLDITDRPLIFNKKTSEIKKFDYFNQNNLTEDEKKGLFNGPASEKIITDDLRLEGLYGLTTTDDHAMHIVGIAKDQNGKEYYKVKLFCSSVTSVFSTTKISFHASTT